MHPTARSILAVLLISTAIYAQDRPTPFNPDSAAAYLRALSVDIGPRPMGSPAEQEAMRYAVQQFEAFGLDQAYVLPFRIAPSHFLAGANTNSGTAVGVLRGATDRIIVIGAHIDSYSPEGPGTNDDGSGSAVVIELARTMAQTEWESTIVFALFGGEESNLKGSYHFVEAFVDIEKVALMLQVDMANGSDWLLPLYDTRELSAPGWLIHAAYEEFDRLGYDGLRYPTHFFALNSTMGGASSDHEPFLRKGIPAIDFTTDISDPIHTPQDSYANFRFGALERSGDLVYRLAERFDAGVPDKKTGAYMTFQMGTSVYLLPFWFLYSFIAVAWIVSIWALVQVRRRRFEKRGETRPRIPGLKTMLITAMAVIPTVLIEDVLSLLAGARSPWFHDPTSMIPVTICMAILMFLLLARLAPRFDLSNDEYRYALRAVITLLLYSGLAALVNPRLAVYPAFGLLFVSLAFFAKRGLLALALVILGAYPSIRLIFSEVYDFVGRMFAQIPAGAGAVAAGIFIMLAGMLILTPYVLAFAGVGRSKEKTWPSLPFSHTHPAWITIAAVAVLFFSGLVLATPPYDDLWRQKIEVTQEASAIGGDLRTVVKSSEYLSGATISFNDADTLITGNDATVVLDVAPFDASDWLTTSSTVVGAGSGAIITIHTRTRPYTLEVRYATKGGADRTNILSATAGVYSISVDTNDGAAVMNFYSFPDTALSIPVTLALSRPDTVYQTVVATFVELAVPVTVQKEHSTVIHRTIVRESTEFFLGEVREASDDDAEGGEAGEE